VRPFLPETERWLICVYPGPLPIKLLFCPHQRPAALPRRRHQRFPVWRTMGVVSISIVIRTVAPSPSNLRLPLCLPDGLLRGSAGPRITISRPLHTTDGRNPSPPSKNIATRCPLQRRGHSGLSSTVRTRLGQRRPRMRARGRADNREYQRWKSPYRTIESAHLDSAFKAHQSCAVPYTHAPPRRRMRLARREARRKWISMSTYHRPPVYRLLPKWAIEPNRKLMQRRPHQDHGHRQTLRYR